MLIPNDTGHPYRMNKFIEYQHKVPPIGPATYIEYAKRNNLYEDDCIMLAWYNSMTYCEVTALYLFNMLDYKKIQRRTIKEFWENEKPNLVFNSARRYVKSMDWFESLMDTFMRQIKREPLIWLRRVSASTGDWKDRPQERYKKLYKDMMKWKYMGRFSVELFMDALVQFSREGLISTTYQAEHFEWNKGSNITSGMLNMFYMDDAAELFDKEGILSESTEDRLNELIKEVQRGIKIKYPEQDTSIGVITPKMCSWRNLFKGRRYGGYHHDRQLEQLIEYTENYPEYKELWDEIYQIRKDVFEPYLLGELEGWKGIRKERSKLWLREGVTGVEKEIS